MRKIAFKMDLFAPPREFPPLFSAPLKNTPVRNVEEESFSLLARDSLDSVMLLSCGG